MTTPVSGTPDTDKTTAAAAPPQKQYLCLRVTDDLLGTRTPIRLPVQATTAADITAAINLLQPVIDPNNPTPGDGELEYDFDVSKRIIFKISDHIKIEILCESESQLAG